MKLKVINGIFFSFIFIFGAIFGVKLYQSNQLAAEIDYQNQLLVQELETETTRERIEELNKLNNANAANEKPVTSPSSSDESATINFTNFREMFSYSINRYNSATYIATTATGTANLSGSASGLATVENETLTMKFTKQKANKAKMFDFRLTGSIADFPPVYIGSTHYTEGTVYEYTIPEEGQSSLSEAAYVNKFGWDMTQLFEIPNEEAVDALTDEELQFYFDNATNNYVGVITVQNLSSYSSNFSKIIKSVGNSDTPVKYNKLEIILTVDKSGIIQSIKYSADIDLTLKYNGINVKGNIKLNYIEQVNILDNAEFTITKPNLTYNNY